MQIGQLMIELTWFLTEASVLFIIFSEHSFWDCILDSSTSELWSNDSSLFDSDLFLFFDSFYFVLDFTSGFWAALELDAVILLSCLDVIAYMEG